MKTLYERVRARLDEMEPVLSDRAASNLATDNRNPDLIRALKRGRAIAPRGKNLTGLAKLLDMPVEWFLTEDAGESPRPELIPADVDFPYRDQMPRDVPLMGTAAGAMGTTGAFELTSDTIDYVGRPRGLANAKDVYALYVTGESMEPRFHHGDLIFVSPHKPISPNDIIVIQEANTDNGCSQAFIKLFVSRSGEKIVTRQYNPPSNVTFLAKPGTLIHKVLSTNEMHGV